MIGMSVAAIVLFGYLLFKFFILLMVVWGFYGISFVGVIMGYIILVVDLFFFGCWGELISYMSLCILIGGVIGFAVGGFLVAVNGYVFLFIVCFILGSVSLLFSIFVWELYLIVGKNFDFY